MCYIPLKQNIIKTYWEVYENFLLLKIFLKWDFFCCKVIRHFKCKCMRKCARKNIVPYSKFITLSYLLYLKIYCIWKLNCKSKFNSLLDWNLANEKTVMMSGKRSLPENMNLYFCKTVHKTCVWLSLCLETSLKFRIKKHNCVGENAKIIQKYKISAKY